MSEPPGPGMVAGTAAPPPPGKTGTCPTVAAAWLAPRPPFASGRAPVTSVVRTTVLQVPMPPVEIAEISWLVQFVAVIFMSAETIGPNAGAPAALPCSVVVVVPSEAAALGQAPAPPPKVSALAVRRALEPIAVVEVKQATPPLVTLAGSVKAPQTPTAFAPERSGRRAVAVPASSEQAEAPEKNTPPLEAEMATPQPPPA